MFRFLASIIGIDRINGIRNDFLELTQALSTTIDLLLAPELAPIAPPIISKSPLELLDQNASDGNTEEFYSCFQSIITHTPSLSQEQFNLDIYINKLLLNIKIYEAKSVIGLNKLLECLNTMTVEHITSSVIIDKMSTIISTLDKTQLGLLDTHTVFLDQITARKHNITQDEIDNEMKTTHGANASEELFVVVSGDTEKDMP